MWYVYLSYRFASSQDEEDVRSFRNQAEDRENLSSATIYILHNIVHLAKKNKTGVLGQKAAKRQHESNSLHNELLLGRGRPALFFDLADYGHALSQFARFRNG